MDVNEFFRGRGRFLNSEDIEEPTTVTIEECTVERVGIGDQAQDKLVVWFRGSERGLVCNRTNATAIAKLLGSEDSDNWRGKRIELICDESAGFRGSRGGIRVRVAPADVDPVSESATPF